MQRSFEEFYNVLFRFLRFAQIAERIKESQSKSGCYFVKEDAAVRSELRSQARQPRVEFTFFNLYLLADVHGASHRERYSYAGRWYEISCIVILITAMALI